MFFFKKSRKALIYRVPKIILKRKERKENKNTWQETAGNSKNKIKETTRNGRTWQKKQKETARNGKKWQETTRNGKKRQETVYSL